MNREGFLQLRRGKWLAAPCWVAHHLGRPLQCQRWILAGLLLLTANGAYAQSEITCSAAVAQLQTYVQQVNTIAQVEYTWGIPARCGYNGYCAQSLFQQLSAWYAQQSALVNQWYTTIARQCAVQQTATRRPKTDPREELEGVDDLQVDNEDATVRIKIPSKPSGFNRSEP